jgi:5,10-methylene-tetrahydrofolate dehydrogenase/methenyl tetrahydrofolate cyclohydrolase
MAKLIDGSAIAAEIRKEVAETIAAIQKGTDAQLVPGLAVVIVGDRRDSQTYVRLKQEAATQVGIRSATYEFPADVSQSVLIDMIRRFNEDPQVHGILVQLPLPVHLDEAAVLDAIAPTKDVDGLHPLNVGLLYFKSKEPFFLPCAPLGCIELLHRSGIQTAGRRAAVIGHSNVVGLPVAHLLLLEHATVTICHEQTVDARSIVREADIVVSAAGQPGLVRGDWIKPGAAVLDVGTTAVPDTTARGGFRLVGDVNFDEVRQVAGHLTPVPRGVGPMTIAMLLSNTLRSMQRAHNLQKSLRRTLSKW